MTYPVVWAKIERADNGWIVRGPCEPSAEVGSTPPDTVEVFADLPDDCGEILSLAEALWAVAGVLAATGSRYDAQRIHIETRPGDKHDTADGLSCEDV